MNLEPLYYKLALITQQLTHEQIVNARKFRNWEKYDKLSEAEKLLTRLEELEMYYDILDPNFVPKLGDGSDI